MTRAVVHTALKHLLPAPLYWRFLAWRIGYRDVELRLLRYLCDRRKVSIDIGASDGAYTVHFLTHSKECYAFEPRRAAVDELVLKLTTGHHRRLHVEPVALSDRSGVANFRVLLNDFGRSTMEDANAVEHLGAVEVVAVPTRRLDEYDHIAPVGCIKIDVEGHEEAVLRGAAHIIRRDRPSLIVEIEERHKRDSVRTVSGFLEGLGYSGFFFRQNRLNPIQRFKVEEHQDVSNIVDYSNTDGKYVNNFVFIPTDSLSRVRHLIHADALSAVRA